MSLSSSSSTKKKISCDDFIHLSKIAVPLDNYIIDCTCNLFIKELHNIRNNIELSKLLDSDCLCVTTYKSDLISLNHERLSVIFKIIKKLKKTNMIYINPLNNISLPDKYGKIWHIMIVHDLKDSKFDFESVNNKYCLIAALLGYFVEGTTYAFTNIENRDRLYKYVMK
jgi:hypothetical protein